MSQNDNDGRRPRGFSNSRHAGSSSSGGKSANPKMSTTATRISNLAFLGGTQDDAAHSIKIVTHGFNAPQIGPESRSRANSTLRPHSVPVSPHLPTFSAIVSCPPTPLPDAFRISRPEESPSVSPLLRNAGLHEKSYIDSGSNHVGQSDRSPVISLQPPSEECHTASRSPSPLVLTEFKPLQAFRHTYDGATSPKDAPADNTNDQLAVAGHAAADAGHARFPAGLSPLKRLILIRRNPSATSSCMSQTSSAALGISASALPQPNSPHSLPSSRATSPIPLKSGTADASTNNARGPQASFYQQINQKTPKSQQTRGPAANHLLRAADWWQRGWWWQNSPDNQNNPTIDAARRSTLVDEEAGSTDKQFLKSWPKVVDLPNKPRTPNSSHRSRRRGGLLWRLRTAARDALVRWYSLRNALALANVIILVIAVTVVSVIANVASWNATQTSMLALSQTMVRSVQLQLVSSMTQVNQFNLITETAIRVGNVPVNSTLGVLQLLYSVWINRGTDSSMESMYVATSDGYFASVGQMRDAGGNAIDGAVVMSYINSTTLPYRVYLSFPESCISRGFWCVSSAIAANNYSAIAKYYPVTKEFYQYASIVATHTWTNVYVLGGESINNSLGLSVMTPYYSPVVLQVLLNSTLPSNGTASNGTSSGNTGTPATNGTGDSGQFDGPSANSSNWLTPVISGSPSDTNSTLLGGTNITVINSNGEINQISGSDTAALGSGASAPQSSFDMIGGDSVDGGTTAPSTLTASSATLASASSAHLSAQDSTAQTASQPNSPNSSSTSDSLNALTSNLVAASRVTATDISLQALSEFLRRNVGFASYGAASATNANGTTTETLGSSSDMMIYVVEYPSMLLVASSEPDQVPLVVGNLSAPGAFVRARANESQNDLVRSTAQVLQSQSPIALQSLVGSAVNASASSSMPSSSQLAVSVADGVLVMGGYGTADNSLQWIIVVHISNTLFQRELGAFYTQWVLATSIAVGFVSVLLTIVLTRMIARPIKLAAARMLKIADLDFDALDAASSAFAVTADSEASIVDDAKDKGESTGVDDTWGIDDPRRGSADTMVNQHRDSCSGSTNQGPHLANAPSRRASESSPVTVETPTSALQTRRPTRTAPNRKSLTLKEIAGIENAMSSMTSGLKSFLKYVPMDVVTLLVKLKREAVLGVDEMPLTIFFSDVANFTAIAEKISPQALVALMSEYLEEMSSVILHSQGVVDKYIGDALMAFWNAPLYLENHPAIACLAAIQCQKRLAVLREKWMQQGLPEVCSRIGINTGVALVGNVGSKYRINYTCLGDAVNLASRLENLNKRYNTEILISEYTFQALQSCSGSLDHYLLDADDLGAVSSGSGGSAGESSAAAARAREEPRFDKVGSSSPFLCRVIDTVAVKGKTRAVRVYELIDLVADAPAALVMHTGIWNIAYEHFCQRRFAAAAAGFRTYLAAYPRDAAGLQHLRICDAFLQGSGAPAGWSPIVILDEK